MYQIRPLDNESILEKFIRDLLDCEYQKYAKFDLYGRRGQKQFGNDILGYDSNGNMILAQVKKKDITRAGVKKELLIEFEKEIESIVNHFHTNYIDLIIFATTYNRDRELQDKAQNLTEKYNIKIEFWGWNTIEEKVNLHSQLLDKYFSKITTKLLTLIPQKEYCMGRESILKKIQTFISSEKIVNLQGIGGFGKTLISKSYLALVQSQYDFIGFIFVEDDLKEALIRSFFNNQYLSISIEDNIEKIFYELQSLYGRTLLVFDNINYQKDIDNLKKLAFHCDILITSRIITNTIKTIKLESLNYENSKKIFYKNINFLIEEDKLIKLIKYLDYHPFFIKLTSKSIDENNFTIDYILEQFNKGNLAKLDVEIDIDTGESKIYNDYLKEIFLNSIQKLNSKYLLLLQKISLFPSIGIKLEKLSSMLKIETLNIELNFLVKKGFLEKLAIDEYKMHQIVKEFLLFNNPIDFKDIKYSIDYLLFFLEWDEIEHPISQYENIIYAKSFIDALKIQNEKISLLSNNLAMLYRYFGDYSLALHYMLLTKDYDERNGNQRNLSQTYNNISNVYEKLNNDKLALKYAKLSLKIREEIGDEDRLHENYLYLCRYYTVREEYSEAEKYLEKAFNLPIDKKAIIPMYNSAILICLYQDNIDEALFYVDVILELIHDNYGFDNNHLYIAYTYSNIGDVFSTIGEIELAIDYKLLSKEIFLNFDEKHPDLESLEISLDFLESLLKEKREQ